MFNCDSECMNVESKDKNRQGEGKEKHSERKTKEREWTDLPKNIPFSQTKLNLAESKLYNFTCANIL